MKLLFFADLHFHPHEVMSVVINGENSRLLDAVNFMEHLKAYALQHDIKNIVSLGDFFHTRKKIDIEVYNRAYALIQDFHDAGLSLHLLAGNHDIYYKNTAKVTSLRPLSRIANVYAASTVVQFGSSNLIFIPYIDKPELLTEEIAKFKTVANPVYILHAEFMGAIRAGRDIAKHGITADAFPSHARVYMGHYHPIQYLATNIMYLGSPIQVTTREINENKYFYVFDSETRLVTPVEAPTPRFAVVEHPSGKVVKFHKQTSLAEAMKGNYVEVITTETIKKNSDFSKLLATARNHIITTKIKTKDSGTAQQDADISLDDINIEALCTTYLTDHPHESLNAEYLKGILNALREKVATI